MLLILAGVSIATLTGENGILTRATEAKEKQADATVVEAISLAWNEYQIEVQAPSGEVIENGTKIASTTQVKIQGEEENYLASPTISFWDFLKDEERGYIDENGVINVEALTGERLSKGNGTDGVTDVYKIEELDGTYTLKYCGENNEETILWKISNGNDTYPEATSKDVFYYTETADGIIIDGVKRVGNGEPYMYQIIGDITDIVIPATINGKSVIEIAGGTFDWCEYLQSITVPETVEKIGNDAFYTNYSALQVIRFPNGMNENLTIPDNKWGAQNAQILIGDEDIE